MITITKVDVDAKGTVTLKCKATDGESLSFNARVVRMDFGTVSAANWTPVDLVEGSNTIKLDIMRWDDLIEGEYALYFNTTFNSDNIPLSDEGPFNFTKENN